jgi:hypothetical protein
MKSLSETWFAEGRIDFELKKYTLLAYLQEVNRYFDENKLYPQLADIIFHYNNIVAFRENKKYLQEHFPKKLTGLQMEKLQLIYEQMLEDDAGTGKYHPLLRQPDQKNDQQWYGDL